MITKVVLSIIFGIAILGLIGFTQEADASNHIITEDTTKKRQANLEIGLETEVLFMNKQIEKAVEGLQFQLLLHNENLPLLFIEKVKLRLEFLEVNLNRLEINP